MVPINIKTTDGTSAEFAIRVARKERGVQGWDHYNSPRIACPILLRQCRVSEREAETLHLPFAPQRVTRPLQSIRCYTFGTTRLHTVIIIPARRIGT